MVPKSNNKQRVLEISRQKYGTAKDIVEDKVRKWIDTSFDKGMAISLDSKNDVPAVNRPSNKPMFPVKLTSPAVGVSSSVIKVTGRGTFDGTHMVAENGQKYVVPPNYAAKSEIVYGDKLEMYQEDGKDRFRQAEKVPRKDVDGTLQKSPSGTWELKTLSGGSYQISQTAVEFNQFKEGQRINGIVPANIENPPFCTLALKKLRKENQRQEDNVKSSQHLR